MKSDSYFLIHELADCAKYRAAVPLRNPYIAHTYCTWHILNCALWKIKKIFTFSGKIMRNKGGIKDIV